MGAFRVVAFVVGFGVGFGVRLVVGLGVGRGVRLGVGLGVGRGVGGRVGSASRVTVAAILHINLSIRNCWKSAHASLLAMTTFSSKL